jgi:hypothetical protein
MRSEEHSIVVTAKTYSCEHLELQICRDRKNCKIYINEHYWRSLIIYLHVCFEMAQRINEQSELETTSWSNDYYILQSCYIHVLVPGAFQPLLYCYCESEPLSLPYICGNKHENEYVAKLEHAKYL